MQEHHIFASLPASGALAAGVARALACHPAQLAGAGYGPAVLGPVAEGGVHVDETIAGRAIAGLEGFFAQAGVRAAAYGARLNGPVARLVVPLLPYDLYFPALWRHLAARRAMPDFATLEGAIAAQRRGWVELVGELMAALQPAETVVLPAPVSVTQVLGALVPGAGLSGPALEPCTAAMPDTALAMLQRLYRAGVTVSPRQAQRLAEVHARQPQPAALAAFEPLAAAKLRRRFGADLERLGQMKGLRIGAGATGLACAAE